MTVTQSKLDIFRVRVLVVGAGVNGSVCAARLHQRGVDVTVLARGRRLEAMSREGIVIENPFRHERAVTKVKAIGELPPHDTYDYVLVVVRRNQVAGVLPTLAANDSPSVVFMSNNLLGPGEMTRALGQARVMMGFVFGAGKREGDVIRAIGPISWPGLAAPFGEADGAITPRLTRLVKMLRRAGLNARTSREIVDYLATHASGVAVIGPMVMKYHNDTRALAKSGEDLRLTAAAIREALSVLRALGHRIVPASQRLVALQPAFLQRFGLKVLFNSRLGEVGAAWHVMQAPDEMLALADDLRGMVTSSGLPVPALRTVLGMTT